MMPGTQVAGSAIDRVFNQSVTPARKFRGTIDAALTLALGSVCAFGLTLGPAPMNTVALSSAEASSVGGTLDPSSGSLLLPAEVEADDANDEVPAETFRSRPPAAEIEETGAEHTVEKVAPRDSGSAPSENASPQQPQPQEPQPSQPQQPAPPPPGNPVGPAVSATALSVVEQFRIASGLSAFVSPSECHLPTTHAVVTVTPSLMFPPGQAKKSLAPDPAYATVDGGPGAFAVTIHSCN